MEKKEEKMSYDLIYQVYQRERQSAALTKLEKDFYEKVAKLIKDLKDDYDKESRANASSTKCMLLYDELKKVRTLFHEIFEYRIRKIALMALTGASEGSVDTRNLIGMENSQFEQLTVILKRGYDDIICVENGGEPTPVVAGDKTSSIDRHPQTPSASILSSETNHNELDSRPPPIPVEKAKPLAIDAETVHVEATPRATPLATETASVKKKRLVAVQILEDIPKFAGEGGEVYILKKKDYASLPQTMAERLEKLGKARIMPS